MDISPHWQGSVHCWELPGNPSSSKVGAGERVLCPQNSADVFLPTLSGPEQEPRRPPPSGKSGWFTSRTRMSERAQRARQHLLSVGNTPFPFASFVGASFQISGAGAPQSAQTAYTKTTTPPPPPCTTSRSHHLHKHPIRHHILSRCFMLLDALDCRHSLLTTAGGSYGSSAPRRLGAITHIGYPAPGTLDTFLCHFWLSSGMVHIGIGRGPVHTKNPCEGGPGRPRASGRMNILAALLQALSPQ